MNQDFLYNAIITVSILFNDVSYSYFHRMFYFFFESKNNVTDPVVLWLTGGPGCSGSVALFTENGPFAISENLSLSWNPYSWDKVVDLFL